jgi:hypothetical protein
MKTSILLCVVLVCALGLAGAAWADAIPFAYSGPGVTFSGTLYGSSNGNGSWTVTGIDATYNQIEVSGIVATGLDPHFAYNNVFYGAGYAPFSVDYLGIVFAVPGLGDVNLCSYTPAGGCGSGGLASILWDGGAYEFTQVAEVEAGPPVPEPASLALFGGGVAATAVALRRYLRR